MRHVLRIFALTLISLSSFSMSADAQLRPMQKNPPAVPKPKFNGNDFAPGQGIPEPPPNFQVPGEGDVPDLRGWLDGTMKGKGKGKGTSPPIDPKMLADLLSKMKQGKDGAEGGDAAGLENMLKNNPAFKNPEFLKSLEKMMGDKNFPSNMKEKLGAAGQDPKVIDKVPDLKEKLGGLVEKAKQDAAQNQAGQGGKVPDNQEGNNGNNGNNSDPMKPNIDAAGNPSMPQDGPKLDPNAMEWVKWMEKNFGNSPTGQQAVKEMVEAMQKGNLKGMLDDLPEFKSGEWKQMNDWGKGTFGDNWLKSSPPNWNLNLGGGGSTGFNGPNFNFGGAPSIGGIGSVGAGGAQVGAGGVSILAIIVGILGAAFIAYILLQKWKKEKEIKEAMALAARRQFELSRIQNREELVEAFDTLTIVKLGEVSRNWNHRVVTKSFADSVPVAAEPAVELGELYERARYSPPQDDLSPGELTLAERDLRAVAGGNA